MTADLGPAATPRPIPTPEDRMTAARTDRPAMTFREARDAGFLPPAVALALPQDSDARTDTTDRSFAAYRTAQERDQLDARAATAEQERDDALDDLQEARADITRLKEHLVSEQERLRGHLVRTRAERDEALEARDVLRQQLDMVRTERNAARNLAAQILNDATRRLEAIATERDQARRLLNQTTAALNVALHHANDNTSYSPTTHHYKQRADELDGCRIALQEATEATSATPPPGLGSPADRAQDPDEPTWDDCAAVANALIAAPGTGEIWRTSYGDITGAPLSLARVAVEALAKAGRIAAPAARAQDSLTDRLADALGKVIGSFGERSGRYESTGWIPARQIDQWRGLLAEHAARAEKAEG